jgi:hypothetical protein
MGFMTEISISNDFWHEVRENPDGFLDWIQRGMNWSHNYDGPYYPWYGVKVQESHHADYAAVYIAWMNSFERLNRYSFEDELERAHDVSRSLDFYERLLDEAERQIDSAREYVAERRKKEQS